VNNYIDELSTCPKCGGTGLLLNYEGPVLPPDPTEGICYNCYDGFLFIRMK